MKTLGAMGTSEEVSKFFEAMVASEGRGVSGHMNISDAIGMLHIVMESVSASVNEIIEKGDVEEIKQMIQTLGNKLSWNNQVFIIYLKDKEVTELLINTLGSELSVNAQKALIDTGIERDIDLMIQRFGGVRNLKEEIYEKLPDKYKEV